jgi:type IV secretory pathway VirD2 relaxase
MRSFHTTCRGVAAIFMMSAAGARRNRSNAIRARIASNKSAQQRQQQTQRAAVRITYIKPKTAGHWKAHGAYIQREAATGLEKAGFDQEGQGIDIPTKLDGWQQAGDERIFRIIISPEAGNRLDMQKYTRDVMTKVQEELGTPLQWVAAIHTNTDHPHVHIALRGKDIDGKPLTLDKEFIKSGFRETAQNAATRQLGFRTTEEIEESVIAEAIKPRLTSLDKIIAKNAVTHGSTLRFSPEAESLNRLRYKDPTKMFAIERRMYHLEQMGLAKRLPNKTWELPADYTATLKALAIAGDKQKMLSRNMEPASAVGNQIVNGKWNDIQLLHARILGHDEDETTGKRYMLLETVDGKIMMLPHRSDTEKLRANNELKRNELITISRHHGRMIITQHGDAEKALKDLATLEKIAGTHDASGHRPGWLGRLDSATEEQTVYFTKEQLEALALADKRLTPQERVSLREAIDNNAETILIDRNIPVQYSQGEESYIATVLPARKAQLEQRLAALPTRARQTPTPTKDKQNDFERE